MAQLSEEELRIEAKKRIGFKSHAASFFIMNTSFWVLWYITGAHGSIPWPVWPMLGWGIGLAFHYMGVYHTNSIFSLEKEMERLRNEGK